MLAEFSEPSWEKLLYSGIIIAMPLNRGVSMSALVIIKFLKASRVFTHTIH